MKNQKSSFKKASPIALAAALLCGVGAASAGEPIEFGDGYKFDWRINTNYTLSQRTKSPNALLANNAAANDGDNNFKKNALTANRISALFEGKLSKGESNTPTSTTTTRLTSTLGRPARRSSLT